MGIFENVQEILKDRNISVRTFENELGLSKGGFYRWKHHIPSVEKVRQAADYLKVDINEIVK